MNQEAVKQVITRAISSGIQPTGLSIEATFDIVSFD
jgi:hypothetical protein